MGQMFQFAFQFGHDLSAWDVGRVNNFIEMFPPNNALPFNARCAMSEFAVTHAVMLWTSLSLARVCAREANAKRLFSLYLFNK